MKIIDLRSDTKTLPTKEMRKAICQAELGDDVSQEDPTVNQLQDMAARMMGKQEALLTTSGIMSNLLSVLSHTNRGEEIIIGDQSHIFWYEVGGASTVAGVIMRTVANTPDGQLGIDLVRQSIRGNDMDFPRTTLLCLENTHNRCGGSVLSAEYTSAVAHMAHDNGLKVHIDGARIFSAAIAQNIKVNQLVKDADSVGFCLSKNLSAPVGSVLCGSAEFISRARRWRRMLGGGMRQAGIIAAAGIVALENMVDRLQEDHHNASRLAYGLAEIKGINIQPERFHTNIVMFEPASTLSAEDFIEGMQQQGVLFSHMGGRTIRAVTHRMVSSSDIDQALKLTGEFARNHR